MRLSKGRGLGPLVMARHERVQSGLCGILYHEMAKLKHAVRGAFRNTFVVADTFCF